MLQAEFHCYVECEICAQTFGTSNVQTARNLYFYNSRPASEAPIVCIALVNLFYDTQGDL